MLRHKVVNQPAAETLISKKHDGRNGCLVFAPFVPLQVGADLLFEMKEKGTGPAVWVGGRLDVRYVCLWCFLPFPFFNPQPPTPLFKKKKKQENPPPPRVTLEVWGQNVFFFFSLLVFFFFLFFVSFFVLLTTRPREGETEGRRDFSEDFVRNHTTIPEGEIHAYLRRAERFALSHECVEMAPLDKIICGYVMWRKKEWNPKTLVQRVVARIKALLGFGGA